MFTVDCLIGKNSYAMIEKIRFMNMQGLFLKESV